MAKTMTITSKVNVAQLMQEAANTCKSPAISFGFNAILGCLNRIVDRAIELGDEKILTELDTLCLVIRAEKPECTCREGAEGLDPNCLRHAKG